MKLWWLSFCDPGRPRGTQFLGVAVCPGATFPEAVACARFSGCNPGGEVQGTPLAAALAQMVPEERLCVLMDRETAETEPQELWGWPA